VPTYEYKCDGCGVFEMEQRITEPALEQCPHCHSSVRRLISRNIGIVFKGSGFYINDSRKNSEACSTESSCKPDNCQSASCSKSEEKAAS